MAPRVPISVNALKQVLRKSPIALERYVAKSTAAKTLPFSSQPSRTFSLSPILYKKNNKASKEDETPSSKSTKKAEEPTDDPFDYSTLTSGIEAALSKLDTELSKLPSGGRFNPEILESIRVHLNSGRSERLGDLAQVVAKGRKVTILVGESDYVKPIVSAIQGSKDVNLQPQVDAQNPLELNIAVPPPTKESRDQAIEAATKTGANALTGVKNARAAMQKRLRGMELRKTVRPDDLKKAHKEVEKLVEKSHGDVKKAVDAAKKNME